MTKRKNVVVSSRDKNKHARRNNKKTKEKKFISQKDLFRKLGF